MSKYTLRPEKKVVTTSTGVPGMQTARCMEKESEPHRREGEWHDKRLQ